MRMSTKRDQLPGTEAGPVVAVPPAWLGPAQMPSREGPCPAKRTCYGHENKGRGGKWRRKVTCPGPPNSQELARVRGLHPAGTGHTVPPRVDGGPLWQPEAGFDIVPTGIYQGMNTLPLPGRHFGRVKGLTLSRGCCLGIWKRPLIGPRAPGRLWGRSQWRVGWLGLFLLIRYSCNLASTLSQRWVPQYQTPLMLVPCQ